MFIAACRGSDGESAVAVVVMRSVILHERARVNIYDFIPERWPATNKISELIFTEESF